MRILIGMGVTIIHLILGGWLFDMDFSHAITYALIWANLNDRWCDSTWNEYK
jgi:hypothetical protein